MNYNNNNTNGFLIHISAFAGFLFPFGNIITPLIAWQSLKDRSAFLDHQGKEAVNFNISYSLYIFIVSAFSIPFFLRGFFNNFNSVSNFNHWHFDLNDFNIFNFLGILSIAGIITIIKITLIIIAALKAKEGEYYKYPFTIKFIK